MQPLPTEHSFWAVVKLYSRRFVTLLVIFAVTLALVGVGIVIALYPRTTLIALAVVTAIDISIWGAIYRFAGFARLRRRLRYEVRDLLTQLAVLATDFEVARGKEAVEVFEAPPSPGNTGRPTEYRIEMTKTAIESIDELSTPEKVAVFETIERLQEFGPQALSQPFVGRIGVERIGEELYRMQAGDSHEVIFSFNEANRSIVIPIVRKVDRHEPNNDPD
jgi:mRNA-degrading endonuclease RelE of RelBE toxin-antitoxin system